LRSAFFSVFCCDDKRQQGCRHGRLY